LYETLDEGPQIIERLKTVILENDFFKPVWKIEEFKHLIEKIDDILKNA
jgi:hypothetical protein